MTNMTKDYYKILELTEFCTEQDIKTAYRRLARKWHPDIAGNTEEAVKRFKELNEAYEILSDKTQKTNYDTARRYYNYSSTQKQSEKNTTNPNTKTYSQNQTQNTESKKENFYFNWEELISKYMQHTNQDNKKTTSQNSFPKRGSDINTDVEVTLLEAINGTTKVINMLHTQVCPKCAGRKFVNGNVCPHCKGKGETSDYKKFSVKIPAGIKDKSKIRLSGEGEKGLNGGSNGDLYITVHIKAPLDYTTEGLNVLKTVTITPYEAVLGENITVKTPDGNVTVKISPNTQNGQKIRLARCGLNSNGKVGDMILTVEIQIPKSLTNEEIELYKKLKAVSKVKI